MYDCSEKPDTYVQRLRMSELGQEVVYTEMLTNLIWTNLKLPKIQIKHTYTHTQNTHTQIEENKPHSETLEAAYMKGNRTIEIP